MRRMEEEGRIGEDEGRGIGGDGEGGDGAMMAGRDAGGTGEKETRRARERSRETLGDASSVFHRQRRRVWDEKKSAPSKKAVSPLVVSRHARKVARDEAFSSDGPFLTSLKSWNPRGGGLNDAPGRFPIPKSLTSPRARRDGLGTQASNLRFGNFDFDRKKCVVAFSFPAPRRARARHTSRRPPPGALDPARCGRPPRYIAAASSRFPRAAERARPARSRASRAPPRGRQRSPSRRGGPPTRRAATRARRARPARRRAVGASGRARRRSIGAPRAAERRLLGGANGAGARRAVHARDPPGPPTETSQPLARLRGRDRARAFARARPGRSPGRRSDRPSAVASATSSPRNRPR